jgi:hypothetical protein
VRTATSSRRRTTSEVEPGVSVVAQPSWRSTRTTARPVSRRANCRCLDDDAGLPDREARDQAVAFLLARLDRALDGSSADDTLCPPQPAMSSGAMRPVRLETRRRG